MYVNRTEQSVSNYVIYSTYFATLVISCASHVLGSTFAVLLNLGVKVKFLFMFLR